MERSRARAEKWARGERIEPLFGFTFDSPEEMCAVLTAQRVRLFQVAQKGPTR